MFTVSCSEEIQCPLDEVFRLAGDYANDRVWRHGVVGMMYEGVPAAAVGVRTRETMRSMGRDAVTVGEITDYSTARTAFRSLSGPVACDGYRTFTETPAGTRFTYSLTLRPTGFLKVIEPILKVVFARQVQGDLQRLKRHLERS